MPADTLSGPSASLTSTPERFSDAAWDLLLASQEQARRWRPGSMDVEHLLLALLLDSRFSPWVERLPVDEDRLLDRLEAFCADQPSSPGATLYIGDALEDLLEGSEQRRSAWGDRLIDIPHLLLALLKEPRLAGALLTEEGLSEDLLTRQWRPEGISAGQEGGTATPEFAAPAPAAPASPLGAAAAPGRPAAAMVGTGGRLAAAAPAAKESPQTRAPGANLRLERVSEGEEGTPEGLSLYGRDLTAAARQGELDPVIGRDNEIRRLIQVLSRRGKNKPVLIGEPGVGKTAVAELLA
ncbi:MAG: Clp protease N-terminal domain-containing protein, partial [Cyanobacteriota bacterium]